MEGPNLETFEKVTFVLSWQSEKWLVSGETLRWHQDKMLNSSIWHSVTRQPRPFRFLLTQMVRAPAPILSLAELLQRQRWVEKKCCCLLAPPPPLLLLTLFPDTHLDFSQRWDPHSFYRVPSKHSDNRPNKWSCQQQQAEKSSRCRPAVRPNQEHTKVLVSPLFLPLYSTLFSLAEIWAALSHWLSGLVTWQRG